ncbi:MAG TPA: hypothetical protein VI391_08855 [Thermoanaerobaculia bacterium]
MPSFAMLAGAGLISAVALVAALLRPRQVGIASLAAVLTLFHAGMWVWIGLIHVRGL